MKGLLVVEFACKEMNVVVQAKDAASEQESLPNIDEKAGCDAKYCCNLEGDHCYARKDEQDCAGVLCGFEGFVGHGG